MEAMRSMHRASCMQRNRQPAQAHAELCANFRRSGVNGRCARTFSPSDTRADFDRQSPRVRARRRAHGS